MAVSPLDIFRFSASLLDGRAVNLADYRGRVLLIVNTASQCGFTPQYAGLQALHQRYHQSGLTVLAFPCNQFGAQEPGAAGEIGQFCRQNYGVSFPVFAKINVNGPQTHPLYRFLKSRKPGRLGWLAGGRIPWNFTKFLLRRNGEVAARYGPRTRPEAIAPHIERLLAEITSRDDQS